MFDYEKYINELIKIKEEEMDNYPENVDDFDEYEKPFIEKRNILNKNNKIIFKHDLKDAWQQPEDEFYILDSDKDNIVIIKHGKKYNYSISKDNKITLYLHNFPRKEHIKKYIYVLGRLLNNYSPNNTDSDYYFGEYEDLIPYILEYLFLVLLRSHSSSLLWKPWSLLQS